MVITQVELTDEQAELLQRVSTQRGVSMDAVLREAVDLWASSAHGLSEDDRRSRAIAAIGIIKGGPPDLAERHDDYVAEAL